MVYIVWSKGFDGRVIIEGTFSKEEDAIKMRNKVLDKDYCAACDYMTDEIDCMLWAIK